MKTERIRIFGSKGVAGKPVDTVYPSQTEWVAAWVGPVTFEAQELYGITALSQSVTIVLTSDPALDAIGKKNKVEIERGDSYEIVGERRNRSRTTLICQR